MIAYNRRGLQKAVTVDPSFSYHALFHPFSFAVESLDAVQSSQQTLQK